MTLGTSVCAYVCRKQFWNQYLSLYAFNLYQQIASFCQTKRTLKLNYPTTPPTQNISQKLKFFLNPDGGLNKKLMLPLLLLKQSQLLFVVLLLLPNFIPISVFLHYLVAYICFLLSNHIAALGAAASAFKAITATFCSSFTFT